jgi:hypothetical protein
VIDLLNKRPVTELATLSNFSKSYISQVKHGKCPPSRKLIEVLLSTQPESPAPDYADMFLKSRVKG